MSFAIAAGHQETLNAAKRILKNGGNAVDAAVCAFLVSMVVEPCMSGVGGGGFSLVREPDGSSTSFDFFCHTPIDKIPRLEEHFYPVTVDFGGAFEDFFVGAGSVATPGSIAGVFAMHSHYGTIPIKDLFVPAIKLASEEVIIDTFQAYDLKLLEGICGAEPRGREIYFREDGSIKQEGDTLCFPHLADFMEVLSIEGPDFFYKGEFATYVEKLFKEKGGHLSSNDFAQYSVNVKQAKDILWRGRKVSLPGFPSMGSSMIIACLKDLESFQYKQLDESAFRHISASFSRIANISNDPILLQQYLAGKYDIDIEIGNQIKKGGTTHFSIMDNKGMAVSLTTSIGEGSGIIIPGTDVQLNNMLGEESLMDKGFYNWDKNSRLISMMSPTIIDDMNGKVLVTGSGGAGRIPFMISLLCHYIYDLGMELKEAVTAPRLFYHDLTMEVEPGMQCDETIPYAINQWEEKTLYFGGTHSILLENNEIEACADPRRYGVHYSE